MSPSSAPFISSSLPLVSLKSSISLSLSLAFPFAFVGGMNCGFTGPVNESSV